MEYFMEFFRAGLGGYFFGIIAKRFIEMTLKLHSILIEVPELQSLSSFFAAFFAQLLALFYILIVLFIFSLMEIDSMFKFTVVEMGITFAIFHPTNKRHGIV